MNEYPTAAARPNLPTANYETMPLHEEDVSETSKTTSDKYFASPTYSEVTNPYSNPQLEYNPSYSEITDQS